MKNKYMIIITIITVCCIIGGTIYHFNLLGFDLPRISRNENGYELVVQDTAENSNGNAVLDKFDSINFDVAVMDVDIRIGDGFYLEYQCTDGLEPTYEVSNGKLTVKQKKKNTWKLFGTNQCNLYLTIPDDVVIESATLRVDVGDVSLEGITVKRCDIETDVGNCRIEQCNFDVCDFESDTGDVYASDTVLGKATFDSDVGDITVKDCSFDDLSAEGDVGDIVIESMQNLEGYLFDLKADVGDIKINGNKQGKSYYDAGSRAGSVKADTDVGSISISY